MKVKKLNVLLRTANDFKFPWHSTILLKLKIEAEDEKIQQMYENIALI